MSQKSEAWKYDDAMKNRTVRVRTGKNHYRDGVLQCYDPESKSIILSVHGGGVGDDGSRTVLMIGSAIQAVELLENPTK